MLAAEMVTFLGIPVSQIDSSRVVAQSVTAVMRRTGTGLVLVLVLVLVDETRLLVLPYQG